ncbi:ABC transporter ATP-binding protein [Microvirga antarctica]|uniref:ABC transporter ATP-binding protein n=1 Tax=Microvirga antarctica TaxID=2819233 RepID=UPI001B30F363|nr:ABC transporter ATP-binding protein [Microvirga antarctica]
MSAVDEYPTGKVPLLSVRNLVVEYGYVRALHGLSIDVHQGEVVCLIGSNGAGKSTTLRAISGMIPSAAGSVTFNGDDITGVPGHDIVKMGLAHVPEGRQVFGDQSVHDNLILGGITLSRDEGRARAEHELDRFPILRQRQHQRAGTLSGGEQQMLAISRGLMIRPRLLLLDEPSMGLAPRLVHQVGEIIIQLQKQGMTILLVEQMATLALAVSDRAYVIQNGEVRLSGRSEEIENNPEVVSAYLGGSSTSDTVQQHQKPAQSGKELQ